MSGYEGVFLAPAQSLRGIPLLVRRTEQEKIIRRGRGVGMKRHVKVQWVGPRGTLCIHLRSLLRSSSCAVLCCMRSLSESAIRARDSWRSCNQHRGVSELNSRWLWVSLQDGYTAFMPSFSTNLSEPAYPKFVEEIDGLVLCIVACLGKFH